MPNENCFTRKVHMGGWIVFTPDDGDTLVVERFGKPGRIEMGNGDTGVIVEILADDHQRIVTGAFALNSDMEIEKRRRKAPVEEDLS